MPIGDGQFADDGLSGGTPPQPVVDAGPKYLITPVDDAIGLQGTLINSRQLKPGSSQQLFPNSDWRGLSHFRKGRKGVCLCWINVTTTPTDPEDQGHQRDYH
jgi:hypothetical protein